MNDFTDTDQAGRHVAARKSFWQGRDDNYPFANMKFNSLNLLCFKFRLRQHTRRRIIIGRNSGIVVHK